MLGESLSPNRTGFFLRRCIKIINHRKQKKRCLGLQDFLVDSGWKGRSVSQSAVSQWVDIAETIKVLQHAIAEA